MGLHHSDHARPGRAFKARNGEALRQEELRVQLLALERALDGAIHFDGDDEAVQGIARTLRRMNFDSSWADARANRERRTKLLKRIAIEAEWHNWPSHEQPTRWFDGHGGVFSKNDVIEIAVKREALKKPHNLHDVLSRWIRRDYDLALVRKLYEEGGVTWREFAMRQLSDCVEQYFSYRVWASDERFPPDNWPGLVRKFAKSVDGKSTTGAQGSVIHILRTLEQAEDKMVKDAIASVRRRFRP